MDGAERRGVAALWSLPGIGVKTLARVRAAFPDLSEVFARPVAEWCGAVAFQPRGLAALKAAGSLAAAADRLEARLRRLQYRVIFPGDVAWPPLLEQVANGPPLLFIDGPGASASPRRRVALVGTRTPETGAAEGVRALARDVAAHGVGIVSGAAEGIDRAAHLGALDAGGETWAFLACAIEEMDAGQAVLYKPIRDGGGTFFSQFPPGARPEPGAFIQRNAWISGSSDAVVVARAPKKSGALHTVAFARRQGRQVLAVPGDPWNAAAEGSNDLLRQGARPVMNARDVLTALGLEGSRSPVPLPPHAPQEALSPHARQVLEVLSATATSFDELASRLSSMDPGDTAAALLELELSGHAVQKAGKRYEKVG